MLRRLSRLLFLMPLAAGCAGLTGSSAPRPVAIYLSNESAQVVPAPKEATYALYRRSAPSEASSTGPEQIHAQVQVASGQPIGFEKGTAGELLAVAGETKIPLPEGDYSWRLPKRSKSLIGKLDETFDKKLDAIADAVPVIGISSYVAATVFGFFGAKSVNLD